MKEESYYEALGISKAVSSEDIKKSYYNLANWIEKIYYRIVDYL